MYAFWYRDTYSIGTLKGLHTKKRSRSPADVLAAVMAKNGAESEAVLSMGPVTIASNSVFLLLLDVCNHQYC